MEFLGSITKGMGGPKVHAVTSRSLRTLSMTVMISTSPYVVSPFLLTKPMHINNEYSKEGWVCQL